MKKSNRHWLSAFRWMIAELAGFDVRRRAAWREMIATIERTEQSLNHALDRNSSHQLPPPLPK